MGKSLAVIKLWSRVSLPVNGLRKVQPEGGRSGVCLGDSRNQGEVASVLTARQNPSQSFFWDTKQNR